MPKFELSASADGRLYLKEELRDALKLGNGSTECEAIATFGAVLVFPANSPLEQVASRLAAIKDEVDQRLRDEKTTPIPSEA